MEAAQQYRNPVVPGFNPDPSVCRAGDEFFLVTSTFTYFPGVPVYRSNNLIEWDQIGNVLTRSSQLDLSGTGAWTSLGVFAPTIRHHNGRFWMITTNFDGRRLGMFFATAEDPAGPWSEPISVALTAIDPDLAWDDDGRCYVHASLGGIQRACIDDRTGALLEGPTTTWSGTGLQYPEAPHLFRCDDWWYLIIAEGGTERGHSVSIARGPTARGPWAGCPTNPIVSHRSTDRPIQNTGHADMVQARDGSWWMVLLGTRPRGVTPGFHVLGRETFLAPVSWCDGWPIVGSIEVGPPGEDKTRSRRHDFDGAVLTPEWLSVRRPPSDFISLSDRPGWMTVHGAGDDLDGPFPSFIGVRQQHHDCHVRTRVDAATASEAGLAVRIDEHAHYEVFVKDGEVAVRSRIGPMASVIARAPAPSSTPVLALEVMSETAPFSGPDNVALGYEGDDGQFRELSRLDGRYLSTEVAGGFTGRIVGIYCVGGTAHFDWFDYAALDGS